MKNRILMFFFGASLVAMSCKKSGTGNTIVTTEAPAVYKKLYGASNVYVEGDFVVIKSNGLPDHKSPYYATSNSLYIADNRAGFMKAPNAIAAFNYTFKIPLNPKVAATHTTLGAASIGIALNGVPFFNQYQMMGVLITPSSGEFLSFDLYGGHPTPFSEYHYHVEPSYLTALKGNNALLGFLLDGFPVYGPVENGHTVVNADLDVYHGHTANTIDYPSGIYHYHTTSEPPYINGNGYYGTPGTWTK